MDRSVVAGDRVGGLGAISKGSYSSWYGLAGRSADFGLFARETKDASLPH